MDTEEKEETPKLCKECFERYQNHQNVKHYNCYYILSKQVGDVRPPKRTDSKTLDK